MGEVYVKRNKESGKRQIHPGKLRVFQVPVKIKNAEKLLPEAAPAAGLQVRTVLHGKQAINAEPDYHKAHDYKQPQIVIVAANEDSTHNRTHNGADDGLRRKCRTQLPPVAVRHVVIDPGVAADVIAHGAKEAHNGIRRHYSGTYSSQSRRSLRRKELGQAENDGKHTPEYVPHRHKDSAFAGPVRHTAKEEGRQSRRRRGHPHHPGDDGGILGDPGVNKGIEPLIFHIPAKLSRDSESPDKQPEIQPGSFFRFHKVCPSPQTLLCSLHKIAASL